MKLGENSIIQISVPAPASPPPGVGVLGVGADVGVLGVGADVGVLGVGVGALGVGAVWVYWVWVYWVRVGCGCTG